MVYGMEVKENIVFEKQVLISVVYEIYAVYKFTSKRFEVFQA